MIAIKLETSFQERGWQNVAFWQTEYVLRRLPENASYQPDFTISSSLEGGH